MAAQLNMQMGVDDGMKLYENQHGYACLGAHAGIPVCAIEQMARPPVLPDILTISLVQTS